MWSTARSLATLIREEKIDIVHARSRAPAWAARRACRMTDVPFVTTYHGIYAETNSAKRFYNSVMAAGDAVIANSEYTARLIRERYGTPAERITVIHRGTDSSASIRAVSDERRAALRRAWGLSGKEHVVLQLARLTGWKGQRVLIEALALPPLAGRGDVVAILAGDAQGRDAYRRAARSADRRPRAHRSRPNRRPLRRHAGGLRPRRCRCDRLHRGRGLRPHRDRGGGDGRAGRGRRRSARRRRPCARRRAFPTRSAPGGSSRPATLPRFRMQSTRRWRSRPTRGVRSVRAPAVMPRNFRPRRCSARRSPSTTGCSRIGQRVSRNDKTPARVDSQANSPDFLPGWRS